jgi:probable addiction module antidote protein
MKKNEYIDKSGWKLDKEDFSTFYAKILSKNPKSIARYKKYIIAQYNKTKELPVFLEQLKILAKAEGIAALAKKSKITRNNIYRFLSKDSNPSFQTLMNVISNLGIDFKFKAA